jgi:hypothetical protein
MKLKSIVILLLVTLSISAQHIGRRPSGSSTTVRVDLSKERVGTRQAFEQRGLAGAVGTNQPQNLALMHRETHLVEHAAICEALGDARNLYQFVHL